MDRLTFYDEETGLTLVKDIDAAIDKLDAYESAEENGLLWKMPVKIGSTVYVICECGNIPPQLDGTLYGANGEPGTATGYYCPYEDNCPHANYSDDCEKCKDKLAIFEDTVIAVYIDESGIIIEPKNCPVNSRLGEFIFLTESEAEQALKQMGE